MLELLAIGGHWERVLKIVSRFTQQRIQVSINGQRSYQSLTSKTQGTPAAVSGDILGNVDLGLHSWSVAHFDRIRTWHTNCRMKHPKCNETLSGTRKFDCEDSELPTRYLEIVAGNESCTDQSGLRFVLREACGQRGRYIALSHRWSEASKIAMTTKANYLCRVGKCSHRSPCATWHCGALTELFGDASRFAVNLGINKIWIDSICIIQDDLDDWKVQSVKMAEYYQFAWLTIAATDATLSRDDLRPRNKPKLARLPYRDTKGQQQGYFYLQAVNHKAISSDYHEQVSNSSLLKRGWVCQEWYLSRRILSFSGASGNIFMQCQSEANPKMLTGDQILGSSRLEPYKLSIEKPQRPSSDKAEIFHSWRAVVETYSGLELERINEDRLVALSGLANEYAESLRALVCGHNPPIQVGIVNTASTYSAGIWIDDDIGLLWEQAGSKARLRIPGIPTWSWASIKVLNDREASPQGMKVRWLKYGRVEPICTVESAVMLHVDSSDWLPVYTKPIGTHMDNCYGNDSRFSVLKLRGRLFQVSIDAHFVSDSATTVANLTDDHREFGRELWRSVATYTTPGYAAGWASLEHPEYQDDAACRSAQNIVALFLLKSLSSTPSFGLGNILKRHVIFSVLYLRQVENPVYTPCYERVGVGRLFEPEVEKLFGAAQEESIWLV
jgi:hypothetical protein